MNRIFKEIWPKMKPGSRIISHAFTPKEFKPDKILKGKSGLGGHGKVTVFVKK